MTEFWRGEDSWNAFERQAGWDSPHDAEPERDCDAREVETHGTRPDAAHEVAFVQQAIQRVYHP